MGPTRTDLSGNPAQRYLRLLVNVAKKCHGRGPPFGDLSKAEKGDKDAVPEIRQILDEHPDLAWQFVDVAQVAEDTLIEKMTGEEDLAVKEIMRCQLKAMREEIAGKIPPL